MRLNVPNIADQLVMFVNPVTLQVVLLHYGEVKLNNVGKKTNAAIVEQMTGIKDYDAKEEQIIEMMNGIHFRSYQDFKNRLKTLPNNVEDSPSTNLLTFLERFASDDNSWIDDINNLLKDN